MNSETDIEEDIKILENLKDKKIYFNSSYFVTGRVQLDKSERQAIENILADRERYKRLAEQNLKDSEEFKNNMCEHRCVKNIEIVELRTKANKYDSLVEKIEKKIEDLDKIAKKKDVIPETVKEEKINGDIVYSKRFKADGYIAEAIINVLQELLDTEKEKV